MPSARTTQVQHRLYRSLGRIFGSENVITEWPVRRNATDGFTRNLYAPTIDLAVGPLNIDGLVDENQARIEQAVSLHQKLLRQIIDHAEGSNSKVILKNMNRNPRCLLAIELEESGTMKHLLGDVANASILGALGIVVPLNAKNLRAFVRIREYLRFAARVGKLQDHERRAIFSNVIILEPEVLLNVLDSWENRRRPKNGDRYDFAGRLAPADLLRFATQIKAAGAFLPAGGGQKRGRREAGGSLGVR